MTTRARDLLSRSRALLGGSRLAAGQLLAPAARPGISRTAQDGTPAPSRSEEALSAICADLALRDLNLVDTLLAQLEEMEAREDDADRLAELYRLDHLATRLRRNAENLRVLAGRDAGDGAAETASLVDIIRGAISSIDHYQRVAVGRVVTLGVVGFAAEDVSRLVAELLDNATKSSPPHSVVRVGAHLTEQGSALVRIEDEGIGLPDDRLLALNERLRAEPVLDDEAVRHMGLAVVRRLAARHGIRTWLDHRHPHGTIASVLLPAPLIGELTGTAWSGMRTPVPEEPVTAAVGSAAIAPSGENGSRPGAALAGPRAAGRVAPAPPALEVSALTGPIVPVSAGTTASGLPRRVSHSLRDAWGDGDSQGRVGTGPSENAVLGEEDVRAGHERLMADFGAFSEGERAARDEQRAD